MKTRDRILECALALFNQEGEPNVSTLEIANELGISPGNLYYHFHGKEPLVLELFERFQRVFEVSNRRRGVFFGGFSCHAASVRRAGGGVNRCRDWTG